MVPDGAPARVPDTVIVTTLPKEAVEVGSQPMMCRGCGHRYDLPLYEMPDGPIVTVARCQRCGETRSQVPEGVAI